MRAFKYILTIALISVSVTVFSQETKVVKNRKKILEKQEQEKEKAQEKSIEEGKERHLNIQTKETKKRMKKNAKKTEAANKRRQGKKRSFFARIFGAK
ncbi:MAG: hypothetical protein A3K10_04885 [Bacteroidetes bacterium RIFCSPLOWO2_12_FULL_31_6]|nr:MAG: hypothetical protein A3K10_04885 [Bacteroidetes bacterium RIFCSPLOWO2_12_FULL_31_6]